MIVLGVDPGPAGGLALIYSATADLIDGLRKPVLKETTWTLSFPVRPKSTVFPSKLVKIGYYSTAL